MRLLQSIHEVDVNTFKRCLNYRHRDIAIIIARWVSFTANGPLYVIAGLGFIAFKQWEISLVMAACFLLERTLYKIFKTAFRRNRPPEAIPGFQSAVTPSDQFSFPSGHTSAACLCASIVTFFFPILGYILLPWAAAVGAARVILGVHFPTDIMAGALMGWGVFYLITNTLI